MRRRAAVRPGLWDSRRVGIQIRSAVAAAMMVALVLAPVATTSAQEEATFAYDQDGLVFTVTYDAAVWEDGDSANFPLALNAVDEAGVITAQAQFATNNEFPDLFGDVDECLQASITDYEAAFQVVEAATLTDADGNLIQGRGEGYAFEARSNTSVFNGPEADSTALAFCIDLGDGNNLSVRIYTPGENADLTQSYDLLDRVTVDGEPLEIDFTPADPAADVDERPLAGGGAGQGFPGGATSWNVTWVEPWARFEPGQPGVWVHALDDDGELRAEGLFLPSQTDPALAADDPEGCLANAFAIYEDGDPNISESVTLTDADGDEVKGGGDGYAFEARVNSGTADDAAAESATIHACWSFGDGQVLWGRVYLVPGSEEDDVMLAYDLLDEVTINGTLVTIDFPDVL